MRTSFNISKAFPIHPHLAKEIARFCIREAKPIADKLNLRLPRHMEFVMKRGGWDGCRSGRAWRNSGSLSYSRVYLRVADRILPHWKVYLRYKHRADVPHNWIADSLEMFVHLTAHELGHAICGFDGDMTGEYQCEKFAASVLREWQAIYRPAACLI